MRLLNTVICRVFFPLGLKVNAEDIRTSPAAYHSAMEMVRELHVSEPTRMWMLNRIRAVVGR